MDALTNIAPFDLEVIKETEVPVAVPSSGTKGRDASLLDASLNMAFPQKSASTANVLPQTLLNVWNDLARAGLSTAIYGELFRVATLPNGWRGPGSFAMRPASLDRFLAFWSQVRDQAAEPELALAPDGTLHAEWYKSDRQRLDVRFGEKKTFFGLIATDSIIEGAEHPDTVAAILKMHRSKPLFWKAA